jgi:transcriptional regulator with XRE-family HTH domain
MQIKTTINERIQMERSRLGLSQTAIAKIGGVSRETQINYEKKEGGSTPNCVYLTRVMEKGLDVKFVLTGKRASTDWTLDTMLRAVVDDLERCSPEKQIEAVKFVAMLAAGMTPPTPVSSTPAGKPQPTGAAPAKRKKKSG